MRTIQEPRGAAMNGVELVDPDRRWLLLHATGERPQAPVTIVTSSVPSLDGAFTPPARRPLGVAQMLLKFLITHAGTTREAELREYRDLNLAELTRVMRVGEVSTMTLVIGGVECSQRCTVTASGADEEASPGFLNVQFLVHLLDGSWSGEPDVEKVSTVLSVAEGGSGPVRPVWRVEGPAQGFRATQNGQTICEWSGSITSSQAVIISGWESWIIPKTTPSWWETPLMPLTTQVIESQPLLPTPEGEYPVDVYIDGVLQTSQSSRVYAHAGMSFI
ncbi:hypothetical protein G7Y41_08745 [Schaalia sp. ZJ405]|uniref:hypothetical protein n=1 Tax=Schaalia sp. ZJ405 TaxID=2709403 RepID=UPI0013E9A583|nr:hypothetical protein [Schaalia sp. ZJ405]QPK81112.1 hypothetical protein G7Y41_08745 [Schaalia sp. ZJ405]